MKQRSGSSSLSALKLKSFASLVKWCAAHYTRQMKCHVSLRDLYGLCVNARTDSGKSLAVWMNQNQTIPGWFPEHITRVFSGISVWKRLKSTAHSSNTNYKTARKILVLLQMQVQVQICINMLILMFWLTMLHSTF